MIDLFPQEGSAASIPFDRFRSEIAHRYRIEREIGHGGMATVYLARDLKLARTVALKVLRPEVAQVLGEARFKQEIELTAPLTHPNILPFIDSDQAAGRLFYVMPYVEGGTLADRLARGPRPTLPEAIEITRQVAAGLAYAHSLGVVHRDIKPANILLATGHAWIADFGIARMIRQAISDTAEQPADARGRLTDTGLVVGTVEYMAPEQHRASSVDGRADEYSLACVLFEMLTGKLPSSAAVRPGGVRQELRAAGVNAPAAVESALERALAIDLEERFPTVGEYAEALVGAMEPARIRPGRRSRLRVVAGAIGGVAAVVAVAFWIARGPACPSVARSDSTGYAVFPFEYQPGVAQLGEERLLADALGRWSGIRIVDQFQLREVTGRRSRTPLDLAGARDIACEVGVRRFILGNAVRVPGGDSTQIAARAYELGQAATPYSTGTIRAPASLAGADSLFGLLADSLLFRGHPPAGGPAATATRSLPARQAFDSGQRALAAWNLPAADSAFRTAVSHDPGYAAADLWLALVRAWQDREPALWAPAASQAAAPGGGRLPPGDSLMAAAVAAMARGDLARACGTWRHLSAREPRRFAAWYGLSRCLWRDSVVVPDSASPSRWRFRSSRHEAQRAYLNAIRLLPTILSAPGNTVASLSNDLLYTGPSRIRKGAALKPDTTTFAGLVGWAGDTLVIIPFPRAALTGTALPLVPHPDEAIRHQRALLDTLALTWVSEAPRSLEARLALVEAMALEADPAAVDSARLAGRLALEPAERARVLGAQIRTLIQFGVPDQGALLVAAKALADTILTAPSLRQEVDPGFLSAAAVLTGRATVAAVAARAAAARPSWDLPKPLLDAAPGLLIYAAMGGPAESIRALSERTQQAILRGLPESERMTRALEDLGRPVSLAFPAETLPALFTLAGNGDWLLDLQAALARGSHAVVPQWVSSPSGREILAKHTLTFDTAWPLAAVLASAGDTASAAQLLDGTLADIRYRPFERFGNAVENAAMIRAMILRATLAIRTGDTAQVHRWGRCVTVLWRDADPDFQPLVDTLRAHAH